MGVSGIDEYVERGGLHWGICLRKGLYSYFVATWPFVKLQISPLRVRLAVTNWKGDKDEDVFEFEKSELQSIHRSRRLITAAFIFEHSKPDYPKLIRYFSFKSNDLLKELRRLGYKVDEL
jgi:hypothetical protein